MLKICTDLDFQDKFHWFKEKYYPTNIEVSDNMFLAHIELRKDLISKIQWLLELESPINKNLESMKNKIDKLNDEIMIFFDLIRFNWNEDIQNDVSINHTVKEFKPNDLLKILSNYEESLPISYNSNEAQLKFVSSLFDKGWFDGLVKLNYRHSSTRIKNAVFKKAKSDKDKNTYTKETVPTSVDKVPLLKYLDIELWSSINNYSVLRKIVLNQIYPSIQKDISIFKTLNKQLYSFGIDIKNLCQG